VLKVEVAVLDREAQLRQRPVVARAQPIDGSVRPWAGSPGLVSIPTSMERLTGGAPPKTSSPATTTSAC
jgi:hypothetical protein